MGNSAGSPLRKFPFTLIYALEDDDLGHNVTSGCLLVSNVALRDDNRFIGFAAAPTASFTKSTTQWPVTSSRKSVAAAKCIVDLYRKPYAVSRRRASRYFSAVCVTISAGSCGAGGVLFQPVLLR